MVAPPKSDSSARTAAKVDVSHGYDALDRPRLQGRRYASTASINLSPPALDLFTPALARCTAIAVPGVGSVGFVAMITIGTGYAAPWFLFNLDRIPPYIPGATTDPTIATPKAVAGLAVVASALVLPGSALACALAFRRRTRRLGHTSSSSESA